MPFCHTRLYTFSPNTHTEKPNRIKDAPQIILSNSQRKKASPCALFRGSYTLEAAVIVPLTAAFFLSLLFFFRVLQVQTQVQEALDYASRKTACEASSVSSPALLLVSAEAYFRQELSPYTLPDRFITGTVTLVRSDLSDNYVELNADYYMKLPISFFSVKGVSVSQSSKSRKWIGDCCDSETEDYVYVTEHGSVYHRSRSCHYLDLSIRSVSADQVDSLRNKNAGRYSACSSCAKKAAPAVVYVTDYGTNYHTSLSCSGLKRTIYLIPLSEADGKSPCSKCGASGG